MTAKKIPHQSIIRFSLVSLTNLVSVQLILLFL